MTTEAIRNNPSKWVTPSALGGELEIEQDVNKMGRNREEEG